MKGIIIKIITMKSLREIKKMSELSSIHGKMMTRIFIMVVRYDDKRRKKFDMLLSPIRLQSFPGKHLNVARYWKV